MTKSDSLTLRTEQDIVYRGRQYERLPQEIGFGLVDQTKMVTAASELARNTVVYGGGGVLKWEMDFAEGSRHGLRLTFPTKVRESPTSNWR